MERTKSKEAKQLESAKNVPARTLFDFGMLQNDDKASTEEKIREVTVKETILWSAGDGCFFLGGLDVLKN